MAQNKKNITPQDITEWLCSTGFLFPRNEVELERFEKLYGDEDFGLTGKEIDPDNIINGVFQDKKVEGVLPSSINKDEITPYRMAARNGASLPEHILEKIKRNQNKPKDDSTQSENSDK
jgi:hypothetical protein